MIKVLIVLVLLAGVSLAQVRTPASDTVTVAASRIDTTVYVTKDGKKFHLGTCQYLNASKKAISVREATLKRYAPCKRCYPDSEKK